MSTDTLKPHVAVFARKGHHAFVFVIQNVPEGEAFDRSQEECSRRKVVFVSDMRCDCLQIGDAS